MSRREGVMGGWRTFGSALVFMAALAAMGPSQSAFGQSLPTGCVAGGATSVSTGAFNATNFNLTGVGVSGTGSLQLQTGSARLDPNNIIIPFEQDVSSYFIYEAAGHISSFGWVIKSLAETQLVSYCSTHACTNAYVSPLTTSIDFRDLLNAHNAYKASTGQNLINYMFPYIKDDTSSNGIFDALYNPDTPVIATSNISFTSTLGSQASTEAQYKYDSATQKGGFDVNNDGSLTPYDTKKYMGHFAGGTEIVYFLNDNRWWGSTWYSKYQWNQYNPTASPYTKQAEKFSPSATGGNNCACNSGCGVGTTYYKGTFLPTSTSATDQMTLAFRLDKSPPENSACTNVQWGSATTATPWWKQGLIPDSAATRLSTYWGITFTGETPPITYVKDQNFNHFVVVAPPTQAFRWIMGVEDWHGTETSNDYDFNDVVFLMERKTGGMAQLTSAQALSPADASAYITSVTFGVHDKMPTCSGKASSIRYYISIDNGGAWVEAKDWDIIRTPGKSGTSVTGWVFGTPEETFRQSTINFSELGMTGRQLIWKAEFVSQDDACQPEVIDMEMSYNAAKNQTFSRSAATPLGNVMYTASFETPAATWTDKDLRGHLISERIYDPTNPTGGYSVVQNWDAGSVMTAGSPTTRNVLYPDITISTVTDSTIGSGDGVTKTFTATLAPGKIVYSTVSITDGMETFLDKHTTNLEGSLTGTGTINRYSGAVSITFNNAPPVGALVKATYQYYTTSPAMKGFSSTNLDYRAMAIDSSYYYDGTGFHYTYDFDGNGKTLTTDGTIESDADWLVYWVRGWRNGSTATTKKDWLLGAIDHSSPAVIGTPGQPSWYYGTDVAQTVIDSFDAWRCSQRTRRSEAYAGSRSGMLHSFYAGEFRPYYVDESKITGCTTSSTNLKNFRDAINPNTITTGSGAKYPYYKTPTNVDIIINRGYYDWRTRSGTTLSNGTAPNYGSGSETWSAIPLDQLAKLKYSKLKTEEAAFVDASPAIAFTQFADSSWHAVVISAEGNGGDHIFALDVTDPVTPTFLWEYADPDLFRSRSSPSMGVIGRLLTASGPKWVVFFVSGINRDPAANASIYMLDIQTGALIKRIYLDSAGTLGVGATPSGQPAVTDSDGNGYVDRMYIGTDKGFMYKITLPDNPNSGAGDVTVCTLFDTAFGGGGRQPIYASPALSNQNTYNADGTMSYSILVLFGTSDSPYYTDDTAQTYWFYAVADTAAKGVCSGGSLKWSMQLPAGQRVFASAFATAGRVYFGTSTADTEDPCAPSVAAAGTGVGTLYALDIGTGSTIYSEATGNIISQPVVDDEHLYFKSNTGQLQGRGGNTFQNLLRSGGGSNAQMGTWREITQ